MFLTSLVLTTKLKQKQNRSLQKPSQRPKENYHSPVLTSIDNKLKKVFSYKVQNSNPDFLGQCYHIRQLTADLDRKGYKVDQQVLSSFDKILGIYLELRKSLMSQEAQYPYLEKIYTAVEQIDSYIENQYNQAFASRDMDIDVEMELLRRKMDIMNLSESE